MTSNEIAEPKWWGGRDEGGGIWVAGWVLVLACVAWFGVIVLAGMALDR